MGRSPGRGRKKENMRLGSSILGGKPMRIPGIVDVYQIGNEWIARSWPKSQNQPNSAAQLLWRKKFKDAHALIKTWTGTYLDAWRSIYCPPGKMWIDIAMHSIMLNPDNFDPVPSDLFSIAKLAYAPTGAGIWNTKYSLFAYYDSWVTQWPRWWIAPARGTTWDNTMKWDNLGTICPKGKRPKIKWGLSIKDPTLYQPAYKWDWYGWGKTARALFFDFPDGAVIVGLEKIIDPVTGVTEYSLWQPPLYLKPEAPPDWMT